MKVLKKTTQFVNNHGTSRTAVTAGYTLYFPTMDWLDANPELKEQGASAAWRACKGFAATTLSAFIAAFAAKRRPAVILNSTVGTLAAVATIYAGVSSFDL